MFCVGVEKLYNCIVIISRSYKFVVFHCAKVCYSGPGFHTVHLEQYVFPYLGPTSLLRKLTYNDFEIQTLQLLIIYSTITSKFKMYTWSVFSNKTHMISKYPEVTIYTGSFPLDYLYC